MSLGEELHACAIRYGEFEPIAKDIFERIKFLCIAAARQGHMQIKYDFPMELGLSTQCDRRIFHNALNKICAEHKLKCYPTNSDFTGVEINWLYAK